MEVIETNIFFSGNLEQGIQIQDHQSRIVKVPSWEEYCNYYLSPEKIENQKYRRMFSATLPRQCSIKNLCYDNYHLSCIINTSFDTYRLAYINCLS